ncbi:polysaccharide biosynthesis/export family protein [Falsihalocynthiibacter sp. BN13B15]|uniref:polysaccharide biosynthesis/export family protein n=1 Tax=Falsihalocynthiibacter sp. BN13B15 TaxID=3240871 RepID=UPI00350F824C
MKALYLVVLIGLSACGAVYYAPTVSEGQAASGAKVRLIPVTPETVLVANRSSYTPKSLPSEFFQSAGGGSGLRGAGAVPEPVFQQQDRPAALETRIPPNVPHEPYKIGIEDELLLATPQAGSSIEELSGLLAAQNSRQGYKVQDDGAISIPDVGRVQLAGLTLEEAENEIFNKLVEAQINPGFSLEVSGFNSQKVSIGGAVNNPTVVPISLSRLKLNDALSAAGGVSLSDLDYAAIRLFRDGTLYQIPVKELYSRRDLQDIQLLDGDSLFVDSDFELDKAQAYFSEQIQLAQYRQSSRNQALGELNAEVALRRNELSERRDNFQDRLSFDAVDRDYAYITGEVKKQARFPLAFERKSTLADALYSEGGFDARTGDPTQIYILRGSPNPVEFSGVTAWHLDARNAANFLLATRIELRPNDVIFIAAQPVTSWNRVLTQLSPNLVASSVAGVVN